MSIIKNDLLESEYASFYKKYIALAPNLFIIDALQKSTNDFIFYFENLNDNQALFKYADDKWSLKEVLLHCIDTERIMAYRALRFARNDGAELPGFDQDDYVLESNANQRTIKSIVEEYKSVRKSTISLFASFDSKVLLNSGIASGSLMSVRALGYVISGHELHHLEICIKRYLFQ